MIYINVYKIIIYLKLIFKFIVFLDGHYRRQFKEFVILGLLKVHSPR